MSWIQKLYETYDQCKGHEPPGSIRLMPISHTPQQAHVEITLDDDGNFKGARIVQKEETIVPATEKSSGRTGSKPPPHPLCDKVQYCANDYLDFGGKKPSFFKEYEEQLSTWCNSEFSHAKAKAVTKRRMNLHLMATLPILTTKTQGDNNMSTLQNKIDFAVILRVKNANPNGDPLNSNRPRTNYENFGEITDVCIKRKIRDRLVERFVALGGKDGKAESKGQSGSKSDDRKIDDATSLRDRAEKFFKSIGKTLGADETVNLTCSEWIDVRAFGQLFALSKKKGKKKEDGGDEKGQTGISIGIRGPVTVQSAFSLVPIDITSTQIALQKKLSRKTIRNGASGIHGAARSHSSFRPPALELLPAPVRADPCRAGFR